MRLAAAQAVLQRVLQLKEHIVKKSVLCLALSLALVLAFAPVHATEIMPESENFKTNPVDQFTGTVWQKPLKRKSSPFFLAWK